MQMVDVTPLATFRRQVQRQNEQVANMMALYKTKGGHLRPAAISLIAHAKDDGMTQADVAAILDVSRTAISKRW